MELTENLAIIEDPGQINAQFLEDTFKKAKEYLKTRVQYVFNKRRANPDTWEVSTWSKHVKKSKILREGTEQDKAFFSAEDQQAVRPRIQHRKRNRPLQDCRRVRRRVIAPAGQLEQLQVHQPEAENPIWDHNNDSSSQSSQDSVLAAAQGLLQQGTCHDTVLPNMQLTDAMLQCARQIEAEMTDTLNKDLIHLHQTHAAEQQMSDGNGGTLQLRMRLASEGVNASDGEAYLSNLCCWI